jgi:protein O-GlcNAc transferase
MAAKARTGFNFHSMTLQQILDQARQLQQAGRTADAEALCRSILAKTPDEPNALNLLGIFARQNGRPAESVQFLTRAVAVAPDAAPLYFNLGVAFADLKDWDRAIAAFRRAGDLSPSHPVAWSRLGGALAAQQRWSEAADACLTAAALAPRNAGAWDDAGALLRRAGKAQQSLDCHTKAVELSPNSPEYHGGRGLSLQVLGRLDDSAAAFRRAIELRPDYYEMLNNLGLVLCEMGKLDEAVACFEAILKLRPDDVIPQINLALALFNLGDWSRAAICYQRAAELTPGNATVASNYCYALQFQPEFDAAALLREHRLWNQRHAEPLSASVRPHENDRSPDRRLRVGYISPNFREHSQAPFILPLLRGHDHETFEVFCYSDTVKTDAVTAKMQRCADIWRNVVGITDEQLAEMVRSDRIDILVDLSMHMAGGRLLVFARKPAPVQVTWLAYPCTTGVAAIDYRLTDDFVDPPGTDQWYTEKSVRLPNTFACFDPEALQAPWPNLVAPPAEQNGHITFGSLNNFCKMNEPLLKLWSSVLTSIPNSRLRLLAPAGSARVRTLETFAKFGVTPPQIEFVNGQARAGYLKELNRIDICLDTLPYNGHTTSLDAMWMGVPVITRLGHTAAGRVGWSLASNLKLTELAAQSDEEFVKIAATLAGDLPRLAELRRTLRQRLLDSPITDGRAFAGNVQAAYRRMWREWCGAS